ncbi:archaeal conserved hypothetical protein [Thermoplasmatales archaeon BRNA1]|nr:archaeal conserved hypothetical protein [Thermoplasmatales archaeon BRNA1]
MNAKMEKGEIVKYMPTSTVGKIVDVREEDGSVWVKLDVSNLYYRASTVEPCDASEYKATSFKERKAKEYGSAQDIEDLKRMQKEVDITDMSPTGGG